MLTILKRILLLLETYFEERRAELQLAKQAAAQEKWLDCQTVKLMLNKGDRTLFNYVQTGRLISKKIGGANYYLESSVIDMVYQRR